MNRTRHFVYSPTWLVDLEPGIEFRSSSPPSASYGPLAASVGPVPHLLLHPDNQSTNLLCRLHIKDLKTFLTFNHLEKLFNNKLKNVK